MQSITYNAIMHTCIGGMKEVGHLVLDDDFSPIVLQEGLSEVVVDGLLHVVGISDLLLEKEVVLHPHELPRTCLRWYEVA